MAYLNYTKKQQYFKHQINCIREILTEYYNFTPEQAINALDNQSLRFGATINTYEVNLNTLDKNRWYYSPTARLANYKRALENTFNNLPKKCIADVREQQAKMLANKELVITPKMASYYKDDYYRYPVLNRGGIMVVRRSFQNIGITHDWYVQNSGWWFQEQQKYTPVLARDLPDAYREDYRKIALTRLALTLTRLQLINQCIKN